MQSGIPSTSLIVFLVPSFLKKIQIITTDWLSWRVKCWRGGMKWVTKAKENNRRNVFPKTVMTIYSMPVFIYSWCVRCLRTFHQLCHQLVFPKWRTGVLWVPAVIYLSFSKHDCSIYPYRDRYTKERFIRFATESRKQARNADTHTAMPLPLCRCLEQQEFCVSQHWWILACSQYTPLKMCPL